MATKNGTYVGYYRVSTDRRAAELLQAGDGVLR